MREREGWKRDEKKQRTTERESGEQKIKDMHPCWVSCYEDLSEMVRYLLTVVSSVYSGGPSLEQRAAQHLMHSGYCHPGPAVWDLRSVRSGQRPDRNSSSLSGHSDPAWEKHHDTSCWEWISVWMHVTVFVQEEALLCQIWHGVTDATTTL